MNIFILDLDQQKAVKYYVNDHIRKIIIEVSQLLCGVHYFSKIIRNDIPYKLAFQNHPVSKWVRKSLSNYLWTCELGKELSKEYTFRYDKIHKCQSVIKWCQANIPEIPDIGLTTFALAMPDEYKTDDPVQSYRNYYNGAKRHLFKWKNRPIPEWIKT